MSLCSPFWQHVVGTGKSAPWEFTSMRVSHYSRKKWVSEKGFCCSIPSNISKCPQTTVCAWCSLTLEAPRQRLWVVHSVLCQGLCLGTAAVENQPVSGLYIWTISVAALVSDIPSTSLSATGPSLLSEDPRLHHPLVPVGQGQAPWPPGMTRPGQNIHIKSFSSYHRTQKIPWRTRQRCRLTCFLVSSLLGF